MSEHKPQPVKSIENLRQRVERFFREPVGSRIQRCDQLSFDIPLTLRPESTIDYPSKSIAAFLDFIADALPSGELYLFGGLFRDLALLGRNGFSSDIDLVVEGSWENCVAYIQTLGARKNKFGGYRLTVAGWPVDIWNARQTWAIEQGLVPYRGIYSLTKTTVLNWDAILMNWRDRTFVHANSYLDEINSRVLNVVLEENPNPLGMAVRVFRHLCQKDARKITQSAAEYLAHCADTYSFEVIRSAEIRSHGNSVIQPAIYRLFEHLRDAEDQLNIRSRYSIASDLLKKELGFA